MAQWTQWKRLKESSFHRSRSILDTKTPCIVAPPATRGHSVLLPNLLFGYWFVLFNTFNCGATLLPPQRSSTTATADAVRVRLYDSTKSTQRTFLVIVAHTFTSDIILKSNRLSHMHMGIPVMIIVGITLPPMTLAPAFVVQAGVKMIHDCALSVKEGVGLVLGSRATGDVLPVMSLETLSCEWWVSRTKGRRRCFKLLCA